MNKFRLINWSDLEPLKPAYALAANVAWSSFAIPRTRPSPYSTVAADIAAHFFVRRAYRERSAHVPATRLELSAPDRQEHPLSRCGPETIRSVGRRRWCLRKSRPGPELGAVKPAEIRSRFLSGPLRRFHRHTGRAIGTHHPGTGALGPRVKRSPRPSGSDGRATRPVTKVGRSADSHRPVASPAAAGS